MQCYCAACARACTRQRVAPRWPPVRNGLKAAIREAANLEARTDPNRLTKERTRTVAGLFGITKEPWHREKVFDKSPASFARG
jgi:hypothetical protein